MGAGSRSAEWPCSFISRSEGVMVSILNRMHPGVEGRLDILRFVIDKENVCQRSIEPLGGCFIDCFFGFGHAELIGPDTVMKATDPLELVQQALSHGIPDVGEDIGANSRALKPLRHRALDRSAVSIGRYRRR